MIYLTYNDPPSGIYYSQVTDVCNFLNERANAKIRLVALISFRNFSENKKKIKAQLPHAIVIRMFPRVKFWKMNALILFFIFLFLDSKKVIARGPFACNLALDLKRIGVVKQVCFDGRGAYINEFNEYDVSGEALLRKQIVSMEKKSVIQSDSRIAVSYQLVNYWRQEFNYNSSNHYVIPCTLNSKFFEMSSDINSITKRKRELGFFENDVILVYSGSSALWQSLSKADDFLLTQLNSNPKIKILLLSKFIPNNMKSVKQFNNRVVLKWFNEDEVRDALSCCDYGILIREKSVTNKVSSPVKFAEYLACGLKIIISNEIGDYSDFVSKHNCGLVVGNFNTAVQLEKCSLEQKSSLRQLGLNYFSKIKYLDYYKKIVK